MADSGGRVPAVHREIEQIAAVFGLGRVVRWSDLGGSWTTNIRVQRSGAPDVVVRIHRSGVSTERVVALQEARSCLADAGVPAVRPLAGTAGPAVVAGHVVEVEPFVNWTMPMKTPPLLERGFGLLGRVHDVLRDSELPAAAADSGWVNWISAADAVGQTRIGAQRLRAGGDSELGRWADRAQSHVESVAALEASFGDAVGVQYVHGDFWDGNVGFVESDEGPQPAALMDFGFLGRRPRVDDLALTVWFWLLEPDGPRAPADRARTVARWLDAYDRSSSRPLTTDERAALPLAVARQIAWSIGGWVVLLDDAAAVRHARASSAELPVASEVLAHLDVWQEILSRP